MFDVLPENSSTSIDYYLPQLDVIVPVHPYIGHRLLVLEIESIFSILETYCQRPYNLPGNLRSNRDTKITRIQFRSILSKWRPQYKTT